MTINPAKLLGLPSGRLEKGAPADLILVDLGQPWVVDRTLLKSRSKNSPFDESRMQGRVLTTMVAGKTVYQYAGAERGVGCFASSRGRHGRIVFQLRIPGAAGRLPARLHPVRAAC